MRGDRKLIGPFVQLVTMDHMPLRGPLSDNDLEIIPEAGIILKDGRIELLGRYAEMRNTGISVEEVAGDVVVVPGLIDAHTHICWAGSRAEDYAERLSGKSYREIAEAGGGIWSTILNTRKATSGELTEHTVQRAEQMMRQGITTIEVKSGYGLDVIHELKILKSIRDANERTTADLIPTCLAAHIKPHDFNGSSLQYLEMIVEELLPEVRTRNLSKRVDIYVDINAFTVDEARYYLTEARNQGFDILMHADQFTKGGTRLAAELGVLSADHLEVSGDEDITQIAGGSVIPVVLPGASLGLGTGFAPARKLLNAGAPLVVASDWNPGSAPMGNLLLQASILGIYEKMTVAETLASITCRAAAALKLSDRGIIRTGFEADLVAYPCKSVKELFYYQGNISPVYVWKKGLQVCSC
ncbi:MAG: imidazolonepropionase [Bacteroidales bacterium]|nr:imidazolonepropionase [Bacteroidales bacterium]